MKRQTEMLKGVLEGLVMEIIGQHEAYGYQITKELNDLGFANVVEGTVYTILIRLEKNQWVDTKKKASDKGPMRKAYSLNAEGLKRLKVFWNEFDSLSQKIKKIRETVEENKNGTK